MNHLIYEIPEAYIFERSVNLWTVDPYVDFIGRSEIWDFMEDQTFILPYE